jgi:hypothetical protein
VSAEDGAGAIGIWRLITGTVMTLLTATALGGFAFVFSTAKELIAIQRDFAAMARVDESQWSAIAKNEARLERALERLRMLEQARRAQ